VADVSTRSRRLDFWGRPLTLAAALACVGSSLPLSAVVLAGPDGEPGGSAAARPAPKAVGKGAVASDDKAAADKRSADKSATDLTDKQAGRVAKRATKAATKPARPERNLPVFTLEREAAALQFVKQHHPELLAVLTQLRGMNSDAYQDAIRELFQTSETIARWLPGDGRMHQLALETWKVKSRIDLLAVALRRDRKPDQESQLRQLLHRQVELQIEQTEYEAQRLRLRSDKLAADAERLKLERDRTVDDRLAKLSPKKKPASAGTAKPGRIAGSTEAGKNLGSPQKPDSEQDQ
jgi:hypothetical protein